MNENSIIIVLMVIISLIAIIGFIYKIVQDEKKEKIREEEYKEYQRKQELKRIEERKENSILWNKEIQDKFKGKVKYKTNIPIKVLIGDYTKSMAPITNSLLRSMGIETEIVPTASDVINRINDGNKYDLIITNNVYPHGESGEMVLHTLKEKKGFNIPIIILTVDQNARAMYLNKGFDEYIPKPIDEKKTIEILPKVIKNLEFTKIQNKSNKSL